MSKYFYAIIVAVILFILMIQTSQAVGLYKKPEFRGRVIDAETRQAIEGAVVVVLYEKWEFGGPGGGNTLPMDAKEILTDKNGDFYFPSYKTIISSLSKVSDVSFIIFKPGYMSVTRIKGLQIPEERYFTIEKDKLGKESEIKYINRWGRTNTYKGPLGLVKLKKAKTKEDFIQGSPGAPSANFRSNRLPLLFKAINEDRKNRGLEGEIK